MTIHSERCVIRPFRLDDIDDFMAYRNNMDWMRYQAFKGLEKQEYIDVLVGKFSLPEGVQLAIVCKQTNALIGDVYIREEDGVFWIGYTIHPAKARRGYAYEVICSVIEVLRAKGAVCIKAGVVSENLASVMLLKKLNFVYAGADGQEQFFVFHCG